MTTKRKHPTPPSEYANHEGYPSLAEVARHYHQATKQRARRPDVQLYVSSHYRVRALGRRSGGGRPIRNIRGLSPNP